MNKCEQGGCQECVNETPPLISCHPGLWYSTLPQQDSGVKLDMHFIPSLIKYRPTHTHTQKRTKTSCQHTGLLARPAQLFSRKCHILLIQKTSNRFFSIKFQLTVTFTYSTRSVWCGRDKEKKYFQLCCRRRQVEMSERELAVCASTDSSEMNVEGGGEELHTYKMYLYAFSVCL